MATQPALERQEGANPRAPYYPALDGLRAVAVVMVLALHFGALDFGWMGVDIFFVLSGFLITGILFDSQHQPHRFRNFYVRRTLRIFPLYYALWLLLLLLTPVLHIAWKPINFLWPLYLGNWISLIQFLRPAPMYSVHLLAYPHHLNPGGPFAPMILAVGHFWSLCVEEQFYLLWPLVVFTIRKRVVLMRLCIAVVVLAPLLCTAALYLEPAFRINSALAKMTPTRLDEFLIGGFAALMLRGPAAPKLHAAAPWLFWTALAILTLCRLYEPIFHPGALDLIDGNRNGWVLSCGITLVDVLALGMILMCLNATTWLGRLMNLAPLRALGKVSYGFYVFHDIPHVLYVHWNQRLGINNSFLRLLIPFTVTLALSVISYNLLERPFLRLKPRFDP